MNRTFKGTHERYLSSEKFWNSAIGELCAHSFIEVTAFTYQTLIELSGDFRKKVENAGGQVSYIAYGYHGTEVLIEGEYRWQSFTPYLQGWAKIELEKISRKYSQSGIRSCVYNCPEILTNSSSIFQGVEISLYPLLESLQSHAVSKDTVLNCRNKLKEDCDFVQIRKILNEYFTSHALQEKSNFTQWPQHSSKEQLEKMIETSELFYSLHKNEKDLICYPLSDLVIEACGHIMLHDSWAPKYPITWIGHKIITDYFA